MSSEMSREKVRSFYLKVWREPGERPVWRSSLEDLETGERRGFADLHQLAAFLREVVRQMKAECSRT